MVHTGGYETDSTGNPVTYGDRNPDRFSFIAMPNSYGSSGKLVFIVSEAGTMYKRDPGSGAYLVTYPITGVNNTFASLRTAAPAYHVFPYDPNNTNPTLAAGPWSKMD
jgi:hypothetical protein